MFLSVAFEGRQELTANNQLFNFVYLRAWLLGHTDVRTSFYTFVNYFVNTSGLSYVSILSVVRGPLMWRQTWLDGRNNFYRQNILRVSIFARELLIVWWFTLTPCGEYFEVLHSAYIHVFKARKTFHITRKSKQELSYSGNNYVDSAWSTGFKNFPIVTLVKLKPNAKALRQKLEVSVVMFDILIVATHICINFTSCDNFFGRSKNVATKWELCDFHNILYK